MEAPALGRQLGVDLTIASEASQHTGSFKFRAAYHLAARVQQRRIITASSGNFGQALALACRMLHKSCLVVMPSTASKVKIDAVREFGGEVELIDLDRISRAERVRQLAECGRSFDCVVVPVGGGGLASGVIRGLRGSGRPVGVYGAEPTAANDAAQSLRCGRLLAFENEPRTVADGARTLSLGRHNWPILREGLEGIVEVSEQQIEEAVRLLHRLANLKVEPTGALGLAALLAEPALFCGRAVCCVASGGNVDADLFRRILGAC